MKYVIIMTKVRTRNDKSIHRPIVLNICDSLKEAYDKIIAFYLDKMSTLTPLIDKNTKIISYVEEFEEVVDDAKHTKLPNDKYYNYIIIGDIVLEKPSESKEWYYEIQELDDSEE